jgi:hypothetical protein
VSIVGIAGIDASPTGEDVGTESGEGVKNAAAAGAAPSSSSVESDRLKMSAIGHLDSDRKTNGKQRKVGRARRG